MILKSHCWADVINKAVWKNLKVPCAFSYKVARVTPGGAVYLRISGSCNECHGKIKLILEDQPDEADEVVQFLCELHNVQNDFPHVGKRRMYQRLSQAGTLGPDG